MKHSCHYSCHYSCHSIKKDGGRGVSGSLAVWPSGHLAVSGCVLTLVWLAGCLVCLVFCCVRVWSGECAVVRHSAVTKAARQLSSSAAEILNPGPPCPTSLGYNRRKSRMWHCPCHLVQLSATTTTADIPQCSSDSQHPEAIRIAVQDLAYCHLYL